jgi:DNA-binding response OmpR family regulator/KaiC/GvpD/RAD55 family RecA-like ATPase
VALLESALGNAEGRGPFALAGPMGCGRTVVCLQLANAGLQRGERVVLLSADAPDQLLPQALSLEIDLRPALQTGQLALLEVAREAPAELRANGAAALVAAVLREQPDASLVLVDPLTALVPRQLDDESLRFMLRELFHTASASSRADWLVTAPSERLEVQPALLRAFSDLCSALLWLDREADGTRTLTVRKSRLGEVRPGPIPFSIGSGGTRLVEPGAEAAPSARSAAAPGTPPAARAAARGPRKRVLVVDANPQDRAAIVRQLEDQYAVEQAENGFAALASIMAHAPDLIVVDPVLPDAPGLGLLAALRRTPKQLPILAVSQRMARAADRVRALVLGAADVLTKPPNRVELRSKVEMLIQLPPRAQSGDPGDAELLMLGETQALDVTLAEFHERAARACEFGKRYELTSSVAWLRVEPGQSLDPVVEAARSTLRAEDALTRIDEHCALLLCVAAPPAHAQKVVERIRKIAQEKFEARDLELDQRCTELTDELLQRAGWAQGESP